MNAARFCLASEESRTVQVLQITLCWSSVVLVVSYDDFIFICFFFFLVCTKRQIIVKDRIIIGARTRCTLRDVQFSVFIFVLYYFGFGMSEVFLPSICTAKEPEMIFWYS